MVDLKDRIPNIAALARELDRDYSHIHAILSGRTPSGPRLAVAIENATRGAIRREDLRPDLWPPHKSSSKPAA